MEQAALKLFNRLNFVYYWQNTSIALSQHETAKETYKQVHVSKSFQCIWRVCSVANWNLSTHSFELKPFKTHQFWFDQENWKELTMHWVRNMHCCMSTLIHIPLLGKNSLRLEKGVSYSPLAFMSLQYTLFFFITTAKINKIKIILIIPFPPKAIISLGARN